MSLPWKQRPVEARGLLNPAFTALVVMNGSTGYARESGNGLPFPLAFLLLPVVLHTDTRERLPGIITTSLAAWLTENSFLRETFPPRVRALAPTTREAVGYAIAAGLIEVDEVGTLAVIGTPRGDPTQTALTQRALNKALYVGRWFARAGSVSTVYSLWGVRP